MANTGIHIEAGITQVNGEPRYRLYARCASPGDLKDINIFLMEIVDVRDPAGDVFARVITVPDLDVDIGYKTSREQAIQVGASYWRASQMAKDYEETDVAVQARTVLEDEINRLISEYTAYSNQFEDAGTDINFPTVTTPVAQAAQDAYDTALTTYTAALDTQSAASSDLDAAQVEFEDVKAWLDKKELLTTDLNYGINRLQDLVARVKVFAGTGVSYDCQWIITEITDFINAYDADGSGVDTAAAYLETGKNYYSTQLATFRSVDIALGDSLVSHCVAMNPDNYYLVDDGDYQAKEDAVTAAQTSKINADAAVTTQYAALVASYNSAKSVCPTWAPDEPLPPDPNL